jgi:hypothetical protein
MARDSGTPTHPLFVHGICAEGNYDSICYY